MKILIICSKSFYAEVADVKSELETYGHVICLPNCINNSGLEEHCRSLGDGVHKEFKKKMFRESEEKIKSCDAVIVLNLCKNGVNGYIGGATFLEMYDAYRHGKKIFMYNAAPNNLLYDEIQGFSPVVINGDLTRV